MASSYSISGLMRHAAPLQNSKDIETLFLELARVREAAYDSLSEAANAAVKLVENSVVHFDDYRLRKLEDAARLSSAAFIFYKAADLEGLVNCTIGAVEKLHLATQDSLLDGRFAQVQVLLNYLSARLRMTGYLDIALGEQLNGYLNGLQALKVGSAHLRSIEVHRLGSSPLNELSHSLRQLIGQSGANACLAA